jgi:hypothetical protein
MRDVITILLVLDVAALFCVYKFGWCRGAMHAYKDIARRLRGGGLPRFAISWDGKSITCHVCGQTSWSAGDVREKYCGNCHVFHDDRAALQAK